MFLMLSIIGINDSKKYNMYIGLSIYNKLTNFTLQMIKFQIITHPFVLKTW